MKKKACEILVHYPENREDELKLRINMGNAYLKLLEVYISNMNISDSQKRELFLKAINRVKSSF